MKLRVALVTFTVFISSALGSAYALQNVPSPLKLVYEARYEGVLIADLHETIRQDGGRYSIVSEARPRGPLRVMIRQPFFQHSKGSITSAGLIPDHYVDDWSEVQFDRARGQVQLANRGRRSEPQSLPANAHDRLSLPFNYLFAPPPEGKVAIAVADGKRITPTIYRLGAREPVQVPAGTFDAQRVEKEPGDARDTRIVVWYAQHPHTFPVRLLRTDASGRELDLVLISVH